jgi:NTE family protein
MTSRAARHVLSGAALLVGLGCSPIAAAATAGSSLPGNSCGHRDPGDARPRIGLALGGGGARGIAHVSVLREIERLHIPIDCIAGTSMGSLVGGLYASGVSVDQMEHLVTSTDWPRLFDDTIDRPERSYRRKLDDRDRLATLGVGLRGGELRVSPGLLQGERIVSMFERETLAVSSIDDFDRLPIPFRAVATDLNTGSAVVLDHGSLAMAMRASMSIPGVFQPVEIDGRVLVDGGLADQVPIDVVRAMGADIVIAVDVGTPMATLDRDAGVLDVIGQISGMLTVGSTRREVATLTDRDVLLVPPLESVVTTKDFAKAREALAIGAKEAEAARPRLARLSTTPSTYAAAKAGRPVPSTQPLLVDFVKLDNQTPYADAMLLAQLDIKTGVPVDPDYLESRVLRVYGMGTFASVTYEVVRDEGRTGVLVHARSKPQGPNYFQVGAEMDADFAGQFDANLTLAMLFSPLSPLGAEARVAVTVGSEPGLRADYYHPFDLANRWLLFLRGEYANPNIHQFDDTGHDIATYDVRSVGAQAQLVREFGNYAALGAGLRRVTGHAAVEVGDPSLPSFDFDDGAAFATLTVDRLDSLFFPRNGYSLDVGYVASREALGSDARFNQFDFDTLVARSFGPHSVQLGARYHVTLSGELPVQDRYRLGGRGRLAGFRFNELTGQDYALVFAGYTYQLTQFFRRSMLAGGTLEYGNAWEHRSDMRWSDGIVNASIYLGFDSWIGPMLFGYGWRQGGEGNLFFEIGKPF